MSSSDSSLTFDVVIERSQARHNRYVYDDRHRAIRLEQVVYCRNRLPADWGTILKFSVEFPERVSPYVEEAAGILGRFVPLEGDRRLRRRLEDVVAEEADEEKGFKDTVPASLIGKLEATLSESEEVITGALIPANADRRRELKLVATIYSRVLVVGESKGSSIQTEYRVADISSIELRNCLMGCWFELSIPTKDGVERAKFDFDSPISPQFVKTFRVIRQLLSKPTTY
ncbi:MAG: hypothetical protein HY675_07725 [Chloroflexi bacterium]|nr:hypothetical protein [Chloroflexota bacterium]